MNDKRWKPKSDETYDTYGMRLYKNTDLYKLNNEIIGFLLNDFKDVDWDESAHRKKFTQRNIGYDMGYSVGFEEGYIECKSDLNSNDIISNGIESVTPKTHLTKLSDMIGEYNIAKTSARKEQRTLRKYMRQATPAILLAEEYREALENNKVQLTDINDFELDELNNTVIKVSLADWHTGLVIDETYNKYNFEIAKKRLNKFKKEILYLAKVNNSNKISIIMLGDLIEGYSMRAEQPFDIEFTQSEQIEHAQQLIYDFCMDLVNKGYFIELAFIGGNHDRYRITKTGRNALPDDHAVKTVARNLELVAKVKDSDKFKVIHQDMYDEYIETINGVLIKHVHGDDESKNDRAKIQKHSSILGEQINILNMGHLHHYRAISRNRNELELYSGGLMGANDYSKKKVKQIANASQTVMVIREDGMFYPFNIDLQEY
jgi:hypothetical protein